MGGAETRQAHALPIALDVAVKVMDINQIKEDYVIKNLCREAKIMSKLNHPCIVALFQTMQVPTQMQNFLERTIVASPINPLRRESLCTRKQENAGR
ncbi:unnamed protein product [Phaedon cochleariae]|uniref:Uncharacterized protein n=1 Tax=Phaedon cochleariae TaxID=80249 RepID=A0A9N9X414_PHACE|nr:unnamed protein product [Phaedon cochleariae]